jgi:cystathionine beta-lyase
MATQIQRVSPTRLRSRGGLVLCEPDLVPPEVDSIMSKRFIEPASHNKDASAYLSQVAADKVQRRSAFLSTCTTETRRIHEPIVDLGKARGHLNPAGLGDAQAFSSAGSAGQSSVGFDSLTQYATADSSGDAPYGGAEYAIVRSPEADAVCAKFAGLHDGVGAIICPSGLSAISTTFDAFAPKAVMVPETIYFPAKRYLAETGRAEILSYAADASMQEVATIVEGAVQRFGASDTMLYLEAPGSGTFEIPDIAGLVALAKCAQIRTVMDNTWASHVRFKPLAHGIDIAVQATTKYEGGYGDTPSGIVIAREAQDLARLRRQLRISGNGAVSPQTCMRLFHRVDSAAERLDRHAASAATLMQWFERQPFVADIISPVRESNPDHGRFQTYFGTGNGLFTVAFDERVGAELAAAFVDSLLLFRVAESWGGHVSLALPVHRAAGALAASALFRFHAGLEDAADLVADLEGASKVMRGF